MTQNFPSLDQGGEMGARTRDHDWDATALGSPATWSHSLRTAVAMVLRTRQPSYLAWGPQLISLYNSAYIHILGNKHPESLGQPAKLLWSEIWDSLGPINDRVLAGESLWFEDMPFALHGRKHEMSWFSFSYTPLLDDNGTIAGIYCVAIETTSTVIARQKVAQSTQALRDLNLTLERTVLERTQERDRLWRNTQDVQVVIDSNGTFTAINPAFTTHLGWLPDEVLGKTVFDFIIPDQDATEGALAHARNEKLLTFKSLST